MKQGWVFPVIVGAFSLLLAGLWIFQSPTWSPLAIDYRVFWEAARRGVDAIYDGSAQPFVYPPSAIIWFKPLALVSFWSGYAAWTIASIALFFLAVRTLCGWRTALLALASNAAVQGLALGQTSMLLSAAILFAMTCPPVACGVIYGVVATIKPQLLVMAPVAFLVRRDWKLLGGAAGGAAASVALSLALFGLQPWSDWIDALPAFRQAVIDTNTIASTITFGAAAEQAGFSPLPWIALGLLTAVLGLVALARRCEGANLVALIAAAGILASPYALTHDTIAMMPACAAYLLSRPGWKAFPAAAIFAGVLAPLAIWLIGFWTWFQGRYLEKAPA